MRFLVDRCAGRRLADWLNAEGHDVVYLDAHDDPGDEALLARSAAEQRVLVTLDNDFGQLVFHGRHAHCGIIRLPDVPATQRIELLRQVLDRHAPQLLARAVISVRGTRIRVSMP